jgi:pimeloyl-ACP methyl ester carboxylesterase
VIEMLGIVSPLTDPTAHGGHAEDAFDLVIPSLPGYGFSGQPAEVGWDPGRIARAWAELMHRLGYVRYVAQGGDQGAAVTDAMGRRAPAGLAGIHLNFLREALASVGTLPADSEEERAAVAAITTFRTSGFGYFLEQATRPQTIGYALLDSPVALAAWMLDHDTDSYHKISRAFLGGQPAGNLTRDHVLDNITLYWLTGTGASAARSYWEGGQAAAHAAGHARPEVTLPVGFTTFPGEIFRAPRSWAEKLYPRVIYFNEADRGGHFAAWEEPQLFSEELWASFRTLR